MVPEPGLMPLALSVPTDDTLTMDEDSFRAFYDRTSRPVWAYLRRLAGDAAVADDLLQETYYRFVRAARPFDSDAHRLHYLFRIAANVAHDAYRRRRPEHMTLGDAAEAAAGPDAASAADRRADLERAMARLRPRDREMLWLAYAHGSTHDEIAARLGVGTPSIKSMLARARQRLAALLGRGERTSAPETRR